MYSIYLVYTGYMTLCCHISGIWQIYDRYIVYLCLYRTSNSTNMPYTWYTPLISFVFVHFQDFVDSITIAPTLQHRTFIQSMIVLIQMTFKTSNYQISKHWLMHSFVGCARKVNASSMAGHQHFSFEMLINEDGECEFGASNGAVSFQIAQLRSGPDCVPVSLVIYIDGSFIKHGIPVKPIYGMVCIYRIWYSDMNHIWSIYDLNNLSIYQVYD